jgi:hypothetical protein
MSCGPLAGWPPVAGAPLTMTTSWKTASRTYLSVYFNLDRLEDVEVLGLVYALPPSWRGRAIKAVLRAGLRAYLDVHHADRPALDRQAVRALVAARGPGRRPRHRGAGVATPLPGQRPHGPASENEAEPVTRPDPLDGRRADEGSPESSPDTGARLDRLLRSFLR